jgi:ABC-type branched-subunit amino acid transport system ATPase component/ABC-type branched-subunit amino acid transport system permease subunit
MTLSVEVVALGLLQGLVYALLGVAITVTYKTSRVLNFALGEMGALSSSAFAILVLQAHLPYVIALVIALVLAAGLGAATEIVVVRPLRDSSRLVVLVATIGLAQLFYVAGLFLPRSGLGAKQFPLPFQAFVTLGTLRLNAAYLLMIAVVPVVVLALAWFFNRTPIGLASRAAAENADAAQLAGVPVRRVSLVLWTLTGVLAGIAAILIGPTVPLLTGVDLVGPLLLLSALTAAMIGGLERLSVVFAAGVALGVVEGVVRYNRPTGGTLEVTLFALVVGTLLVRRGLGSTLRGGETSSWSLAGGVAELPDRVRDAPVVRAVRRGGLTAIALVAGTLPLFLSNSSRTLAATVVLFALMGLSLVVLTGYAGQISLGQFAFVQLGALAGGRLHQLGYPLWVALLYAACAGGVVALVVGLPALRVRGLFLAVTTMAFAIAAQTWLPARRQVVATVNGVDSRELTRPHWFGIDWSSDLHYYWLCLAVLGLTTAAVARLRRTGTGRAMVAVRDNERAAASLGISPRTSKLTAFVLAGVIASTAGFFYGGLLGGFRDPSIFTSQLSLALIAMVVFGGVTTATGALVGAIWIYGLGYAMRPVFDAFVGANATLVVSGVGLLAAVLSFPGGLAPALYQRRDRWLEQIASRGDPAPADAPPARERPRLPVQPRAVDVPPSPALEARDVVVSYGGNRVLTGVSVHAGYGEIVALVGPNGAGKTTLFDVLCGQLAPDHGRVLLDGVDVTLLRPEQRARRGLGRTFQQAKLFEGLTLRECVQVALECADPSEVVPSLLALPPSVRAERAKRLRADEVIDLLGLAELATSRVGQLSTGTRRLVELGTVVALGARVILLDEPTAGVAQREVEAFGRVLRDIRDHLDATMVVIEHDLPLLASLADRMYVLASGQVLAEGPPSVVRGDPAVVAAYLGTDTRVITRSGKTPVEAAS